MVAYVVLTKFKNQGGRTTRRTVKRAQVVREKMMAAGGYAIGIALLLILLVACATTSEADTTRNPSEATVDSPLRVLLIGNSIIFHPEDLDHPVNRLVGSSDPTVHVETESVVLGGGALNELWRTTQARQVINEGNFDVVVLQEDLPISNVESFHETARLFVEEIKDAGAKPFLFMAWSYKGRVVITLDEIAQAHFDIATEMGVDVAPVGPAWQRAMEDRPELDMYHIDGEHFSIYGAYLAANVLYATVLGESPVGLAYRPPEGRYYLSNKEIVSAVTNEEAAFLQSIAWETVQEHRVKQ